MAQLDYGLDQALDKAHRAAAERVEQARADLGALATRRGELPGLIVDAEGDDKERLIAELSQIDARQQALALEIGELERRAHDALIDVYREAVERLAKERNHAAQELRDLREQQRALDRDMRLAHVGKHRKRLFGEIGEDEYHKRIDAMAVELAEMGGQIRGAHRKQGRAARRATRARHALERVQSSGAWQGVM